MSYNKFCGIISRAVAGKRAEGRKFYLRKILFLSIVVMSMTALNFVIENKSLAQYPQKRSSNNPYSQGSYYSGGVRSYPQQVEKIASTGTNSSHQTPLSYRLGITGTSGQIVSGQNGGESIDLSRTGTIFSGNSPFSVLEKRFYSVGTRPIRWSIPYTSNFLEAQVYYPILGSGSAACPVVIYSHGLGAMPEQYKYLGNMWASRGIVSFFLFHPGTDATIWQGKIRPMGELKEAFRENWNGRERALAIRFAIDRICELSGSGDPLGNIIDSNRIGISGNNLGALGALLTAGQLPPDNGPSLKDPRIKAVIAMSPPVYCARDKAPLVYQGIDIPFISFSGTDDNSIVGTTQSYQRRIPFDNIQGGNRYHVTLQGADHQIYCGHQMKRRGKNDSEYQRIVMNVSTLFWGCYLLNDPEAYALIRRGCSELLRNKAVLEIGAPANFYQTYQSMSVER